MEELRKYLNALPLEEQKRFAGGCGTTIGYLRKALSKNHDLGAALCVMIESSSNQIHIIPFRGNDIERKARVMTSNRQVPLSDMAKARVIRDLSAFNLTTQEIARYVHLSVPTVEKLMMLGMANHDVQQAVTSGDVALSAAVERVKEFGEKAGEVLEQDKAAAAAAGKKKVTRSFIAPEISVKKARRLVELVALADISEEGSIKLDGLPLAEVLEIIEEHNSIAAQRSKGVQS